MSETTFKIPRFRSPSYPGISLSKAISRASELHQVAQHHQVPRHVLAEAWDYKLKSSALSETAAALSKFGLMNASGSGEKRRYSLSNKAIRIVSDPDTKSPKRITAIKECALNPKVFKDLWDKYGSAGVSGKSDQAIISYLTLDLKDKQEPYFSPSAAESVITTFKDTFLYADLTTSDIIEANTGTEKNSESESGIDNSQQEEIDYTQITQGSWVQWEVDGVLKFPSPQRVRAVQVLDGRKWVFVDNSETGVPIEQVKLEKRASVIDIDPKLFPKLPENSSSSFSNPKKIEELENSWREITQLNDGEVTLIIPADISIDSLPDLEDWFELILKKLHRRVSN